jgi:hypothetical protein
MTSSYASTPGRLVESDVHLPKEITVDADKPTANSLLKYFFETSLFISHLYPSYSVANFFIASMVPQINYELNNCPAKK